MYGQFTHLVIGVIALLGLSTTVVAVAGIVVAIVIVIGGVLVFRSGKNKSAQTSGGTNGNNAQNAWQQSQQMAAGGWNPQGNAGMNGMNSDGPAWAQQGQMGQMGQMGQQGVQPGWNNQGIPQQQTAWGGGQDAQAPWAAQGNQTQQAQQPSWMQNAQQSSAPSWAAQGNQPQQPAANGWANQGNQGFQTVQDSWGTQAAGMGQNQGMQQSQQPQTAYGAGNTPSPTWNPSGFSGSQGPQAGANNPADSWSAGMPQSQYAAQSANNAMGGFAAPAVPSAPSAPSAPSSPLNSPAQSSSWQQGNYGQGGQGGNAVARQSQPFTDNTMLGGDNDRTILRPMGSGLGVVRVEEGKEPGREYEIRKESLSIGRSRESDIFLEDLAVSRLHASIVNQGSGNYALKDEGSANGTKVNGQQVGKYQTYPLQDGDRIQMGQTVLVFGHR